MSLHLLKYLLKSLCVHSTAPGIRDGGKGDNVQAIPLGKMLQYKEETLWKPWTAKVQ
jgi:hypothetical protein